jgi:hypothetical protein
MLAQVRLLLWAALIVAYSLMAGTVLGLVAMHYFGLHGVLMAAFACVCIAGFTWAFQGKPPDEF